MKDAHIKAFKNGLLSLVLRKNRITIRLYTKYKVDMMNCILAWIR